ncbi:peptidylprolyl isomerase [Cupriavidus sp. YAF13]|uniref:peptidylprolyl isomerase n=1 Tax=Cupriavidus sp. YAF13 TaxID=3233075 RepID=UPI003F9367FC
MKSHVQSMLPPVRMAIGVLLASWLSAAPVQAAEPATAGGLVVARAGSVTVGQDDVERLLQGLPEADRAAARSNRAGIENWLRQRLASEALLREAQGKAWAERPEVKARVDAAVREIAARIVTSTYLESVTQVPAGYPSELEVKAAYEEGKVNFQVPATYRVAQIFLAAQGSDAAAKVRDEARKLATQARQGDFAALAKSRSQDPRGAERGGEVGTLPLAQMLPEVRDTVARLKVGQVSDPVQSAAGFHVMKLLDTQAGRTATLDEIKPQLAAAMRQQRQQQLVQAYMAKLVAPGTASIDTAALDAVLQKVN